MTKLYQDVVVRPGDTHAPFIGEPTPSLDEAMLRFNCILDSLYTEAGCDEVLRTEGKKWDVGGASIEAQRVLRNSDTGRHWVVSIITWLPEDEEVPQ